MDDFFGYDSGMDEDDGHEDASENGSLRHFFRRPTFSCANRRVPSSEIVDVTCRPHSPRPDQLRTRAAVNGQDHFQGWQSVSCQEYQRTPTLLSPLAGAHSVQHHELWRRLYDARGPTRPLASRPSRPSRPSSAPIRRTAAAEPSPVRQGTVAHAVAAARAAPPGPARRTTAALRCSTVSVGRPVSPRAPNALRQCNPTPRKTGTVVSEKAVAVEVSTCVICLEVVYPADTSNGMQKLHALSCGHLFHAVCIQQWLDESMTCPLCKHEVPDVRFGRSPEYSHTLPRQVREPSFEL